ncbi:MAG: phosphate propanoyltransferase [Bacilli bacterium]|nr:phosphate propanoyltransferase [Bacilli bacterium]
MKIPVGVSNRHVHLKRETLESLFGQGFELTKRNDLTQPGQFAANETVTIKTDKGSFDKVRILGPLRSYDQIEISKTDAYKLGLNPPVRNSGDLVNSERITIVGPLNSVKVEGCIIPNRHIHISKSDAKLKGYENNQRLSVKIPGEKSGIIDNVYIKILDVAFFEMHLDTDDANAHLVKQGDEVDIYESI